MHKNGPPPPYEPPPYAPPAYSQNVGGVPPASPFTPAQTCKSKRHWIYINIIGNILITFSVIFSINYLYTCFVDGNGPTIVTTIVPVGPQSTHTICPHCHAEIDTVTKTEPGMIAYISGVIIALLG